MIEIRHNFFETNSSSVHVLVIPKETKINIPHKVFLNGGTYGDCPDKDFDTLNYMYQACIDNGKNELDKFFDYLKRKGVEEIHSQELNWVTDDYGFEYAENQYGYIDHSENIPLDTLFANESLLDRFLFSMDSFVETGDDYLNEDNYDPNVYDTIEKGN